jgi:hypothetical protein
MIAMQVRDKQLATSIHLYPIPKYLHLRAFTAINQKIMLLHLQQLRSVVPTMERTASGVAQNGEEHFI